MTDANSLVDPRTTPTEPGSLIVQGDDWTTGAGLLSDSDALANAIVNGDALLIVISGVAVGLDALSASADPLGALIGTEVTWALEHLQPLKQVLDALTGNAQVVQGRAQTWSNIQNALSRTAADYRDSIARGTSDWTGPAADAYRAKAEDLANTIAALASLCGSNGALTLMVGQACAVVRWFVESVISELVSEALDGATEEAGSLGLATPVVLAQFGIDAADGMARVAVKVAELLDKLTAASSDVGDVLEFVQIAYGVLRHVADAGAYGSPPPVPRPAI